MSGDDIDLLLYVFVCSVLSVRYAKLPAACVFKGLDSSLRIRESLSISHVTVPIDKTIDFSNLIFVEKLIDLFFHCIAS